MVILLAMPKGEGSFPWPSPRKKGHSLDRAQGRKVHSLGCVQGRMVVFLVVLKKKGYSLDRAQEKRVIPLITLKKEGSFP